ncbi:MAG: pilus assembly protein PilP, partial [Desulfobacteraceae bacterium]
KEKLEQKEKTSFGDNQENEAGQVTKESEDVPGGGETVSVTLSRNQPAKVPMVTSAKEKGAGDKMGVKSEKSVPDEPLKKETGNKADSMAGESSYVSTGKIDPFHPLIQTEKEKKKQAEAGEEKAPSRILTPLEKLDFSQMKLAAIVHAPSGNMAMVEESGGKGYIVRIGTFIGKNSGRVIKIEKDRIVIEERVKNFKGDFVERSREMKLHKKEYEG